MGFVYVIGGMFSSVTFALCATFFVVVPTVVALIGVALEAKLFPALMLVGCSVTVAYILTIYARDYVNDNSSTAFVHERVGWVYVAVNSTQILLSVIQLRRSPLQDGVIPWPH
jgi:hypothetical protein